MNTNLKVGDRVKVISCYDSDCIGKEGFVAFINKSECYISVRFRHNDSIRKLYVDPLVGIELTLQLIQDNQPTPHWRPIDKDNLPDEPVLAGNIEKEQIVVNRITINHLDGTIQSHNRREYFEVTHYILLTDLLNLPIAE